MNVSKFKLVLKYMTGGITSVIDYILDLFNEMIAKLPAEGVAKYATLAADTAKFIDSCCVLITNEAKQKAAKVTAQCFADLATALADSKLTKDELDAVIAEVKDAIKAWEEAK